MEDKITDDKPLASNTNEEAKQTPGLAAMQSSPDAAGTKKAAQSREEILEL